MSASPFLQYTFKDQNLLELAFIHKSFGNEFHGKSPRGDRDNERLEFLGDAILDLVISEMLLVACPDACEGHLSKLRAALVNEKTLAKIASDMGLSQFIRLGKGEELTGGRDKPSILASCFEALIAAMYLDGGYDEVRKWLQPVFKNHIQENQSRTVHEDFKTALQEIIQAKYRKGPKYDVVQSSGPDHDKTFEVQLSLNGKILSKARGKSKKEAEQRAAQIVFETFNAGAPLEG